MTRTAKRRWTREFEGEIDGIAFGDDGPVWVHGYDPPVGGKWIDNVIPGKLGAFDRGNGEQVWLAPCEVGYGRGFGAGLGDADDLIVLGPNLAGHRMARMSRTTGELIEMNGVEPFDQALVFEDVTLTLASGRVAGIQTPTMTESWSFSREKERYHILGRDGSLAYVVATDPVAKLQGVLAIDAQTGDLRGTFLLPEYGVIHDIAVGDGVAVVLSGGTTGAPVATGALLIEAFSTSEDVVATPLWAEPFANPSNDEGLPDVSLSLDSGKLYLVGGAMLDVRDALTGHPLGEFAIPGLDERVAWRVSQGAALLAEETRVSVFEIPA
jgi:hypothetical protein